MDIATVQEPGWTWRRFYLYLTIRPKERNDGSKRAESIITIITAECICRDNGFLFHLSSICCVDSNAWVMVEFPASLFSEIALWLYLSWDQSTGSQELILLSLMLVLPSNKSTDAILPNLQKLKGKELAQWNCEAGGFMGMASRITELIKKCFRTFCFLDCFFRHLLKCWAPCSMSAAFWRRCKRYFKMVRKIFPVLYNFLPVQIRAIRSQLQ